jgi:hypothetical protein
MTDHDDDEPITDPDTGEVLEYDAEAGSVRGTPQAHVTMPAGGPPAPAAPARPGSDVAANRADALGIDLVPLNIADLDENQLQHLFPSPVQMQGALHIARDRLGRAPAALERLRGELLARKREYTKAYAREYMAADGAEHVRKQAALGSDAVVRAQENVDLASIALEYGKDLKAALFLDIELLRSMNANLRAEGGHR